MPPAGISVAIPLTWWLGCRYVCRYKGPGSSLSLNTPNMGGGYTQNVAQAATTEMAAKPRPTPATEMVGTPVYPVTEMNAPATQMISSSQANEFLTATNAKRALHGSPALTWYAWAGLGWAGLA